MLELTLRLVFSLAAVIGLLLLLAKLSSRRFGSRHGATLTVLHRQSLSRSATVSLVTVGERVLLLGVTDQQVSLLAELDPDELPEPEEPETDPTSGPAGREGGRPGLAEAVKGTVKAAVAASGKGATKAPQADQKAALRSGNPARKAAAQASTDGALAGSVLSPQTWREAYAAATRRAS